MNSPFGSSNQGGFRQQPQQQNFSQQGGFGVQTAGTFGGFQPQQQSFGFGGGQGFGGFQPQQSFGGFGGGQGFGGFNPFQGGFGGFQQQQQFNPYQGGFGGGFNPYQGGFQPQQQQFNPFQGGYGGMPQQGFNPMFGGIGGLGFNPMMGPQFGMPMQGFNPYQIQMMDRKQQFDQQQFNPDQTPVMGDMMYRGGPPTMQDRQFSRRRAQDMRQMQDMAQQSGAGQTPPQLQEFAKQQPGQTISTMGGTGEYAPKTGRVDLGTAGRAGGAPFTGPQRSAQDILSMAVGKMPQDMQYDLNKDGKISSADALAYHRQYGQQPQQPSNDPNRPPSGNLAPPQSPYSPPTSSDGKWVFSSGQWYPNSTVSILPAPESPGLGRLAYDPAYERPAGYGTTQPAVPQRAQQTIADYRRQPMFGGIGGLGFNPMMGPQFGMPLTADQKYQQAQQFGNQAYLNRPEVRQANEDYSRRMQEAALAARG